MSIGMTPFRALYGYETLSFIDLALCDIGVPLAQDWLQENQDIMRSLRKNLQQAQNQQKIYTGRHRIERAFEVDDMVFLRLQPYQQSTIKRGYLKSSNHVFMVHTESSAEWGRLHMRLSYLLVVEFIIYSMYLA